MKAKLCTYQKSIFTVFFSFFGVKKCSIALPAILFMLSTESKEKRGENSDFWFLGRTVRADIFGRIYLGSKMFSQMAALWAKVKIKNLL